MQPVEIVRVKWGWNILTLDPHNVRHMLDIALLTEL